MLIKCFFSIWNIIFNFMFSILKTVCKSMLIIHNNNKLFKVINNLTFFNFNQVSMVIEIKKCEF